MKKLILVVSMLTLIGCAKSKFQLNDHVDQTENGPITCTILSTNDGVNISCPDGTNQTINHGNNGSDGTDGDSGTDGLNFISEIIDPCGDDPGHHDEVILKLHDGSYLAWYIGLGFTLLHNNVRYRTTDHQKCKFKVDVYGNYQEI